MRREQPLQPCLQRCHQLLRALGSLSGQLDGPSSYLMKSPMNQRPDSEARDMTEAFIKEYTRKPLPTDSRRKAKAKS